MRQHISKASTWLSRGAEFVAAMMLAVMFGSFLLTILYRYVLNWPAGWASELSTIMWMWLVLWGAAFVTREREEIRFDILYGAVPAAIRRLMFVIFALVLIGLFLLSLPAIWDYVTFMRVQRTAYLRIRFDWLFSIYVVFAVAIVIRYAWLTVQVLRGHDPLVPEIDEDADASRRP
ncbi:TRAP transporter small permease subunit [Mesorhizobium sp. YIM 152430]|jgi:TRAP-type C4-dicarboxylate transport system permease small subunit|uniref:TRAP transporter small permease n=1 Tax=Mesorhizobium sp. YIM 152430 TaxID=3031761 RepID=UPI0023DC4C63|nr:TRAP transporter small permease subunit [Mesorhizobium sp. YIM 152430]MDF1599324.1 TRAP transporter small permease subunit [Mesorhizobium sp. YIM 152430]